MVAKEILYKRLEKIIKINNYSEIGEGIEAYEKGILSIDSFIFYLKHKLELKETEETKIRSLFLNDNFIKIDESPLISVIIPTYNRKKMLVQAIESVLSQTYSNIEIIIVDDQSNDGTENLINNQYQNNEKVRYFRNTVKKDAGLNRNYGYQRANGEFIIFLDDDDYYIDKDYFKKAIRKHLEIRNLSFVCANTFIYKLSEDSLSFSYLNLRGKIDSNEYLEGFQTKYKKAQSTFTAVFRKSVLDKYEFSEMVMMNDAAIYLRALLSGCVFIFEDIVGVYRIHDNNISKNIPIEFLLKTLDEKIWVYRKLNSKQFDKSKWILKQLTLTINYYILGSKPDSYSIKLIHKWIDRNINELKYKIRFNILLSRIRSLLK